MAERQRYEAEVAEVLADAAWHAVMACRRAYRVAVQEWQLAYRRAIECGALDDEHGAAESSSRVCRCRRTRYVGTARAHWPATEGPSTA